MNKNKLAQGFITIHRHRLLKWLQWVVGAPVHLIALFLFLMKKSDINYKALLKEKIDHLKKTDLYQKLLLTYQNQYEQKQRYFNRPIHAEERTKFVSKHVDERLTKRAEEELAEDDIYRINYMEFFQSLLDNKRFLLLSFIPGIILQSMSHLSKCVYSLYFRTPRHDLFCDYLDR